MQINYIWRPRLWRSWHSGSRSILGPGIELRLHCPARPLHTVLQRAPIYSFCILISEATEEQQLAKCFSEPQKVVCIIKREEFWYEGSESEDGDVDFRLNPSENKAMYQLIVTTGLPPMERKLERKRPIGSFCTCTLVPIRCQQWRRPVVRVVWCHLLFLEVVVLWLYWSMWDFFDNGLANVRRSMGWLPRCRRGRM